MKLPISILSHFANLFMSKSMLRWEHILIIGLLLMALHAYGRFYRAEIRRRWRGFKAAKPRVWKPRGPDDCPQCREKIRLSFFRPRTDVIPYAERKSPRGAKKTIVTEGYACPNVECAYFGVISEALHALVGDGKRGQQQNIQYFKCRVVASLRAVATFHPSAFHPVVPGTASGRSPVG